MTTGRINQNAAYAAAAAAIALSPRTRACPLLPPAQAHRGPQDHRHRSRSVSGGVPVGGPRTAHRQPAREAEREGERARRGRAGSRQAALAGQPRNHRPVLSCNPRGCERPRRWKARKGSACFTPPKEKPSFTAC